MMGGGMDEMMKMMMPGNMAGPMRTGMQLFMRHAEIRRTVTELPNGIHAVTESDDPQTAALIQAHVGAMYQRLDQQRAFPYPMSRSVPALFARAPRSQSAGRPERHGAQRPHIGTNENTTWSPGARSVTSRPSSSTIPAAS